MSNHATTRGSSTEKEHHGVGHVVPIRTLVATGFALLVLTVVTVAVAQFDFGNANIVVALVIAVLKASLVVLFFMHLLYDRPFNSFILVASIAFVALFIGFALMDTLSYRGDLLPGDGAAVEQRMNELAAE